jgi:large subunit ribosomal protein L25
VSEVRIAAELRSEFGKGAARRTRRAGLVPGVIYGHSSEPQHISLPARDLTLALRTSNVLLQVDLDGKTILTLPKAAQRDPIKQTIEHIDLVIVRKGEKVTVDVTITIVGKVIGGLVELVNPSVTVEAEATHIPREILVDIEGLEVGASIRAGELVLPDGTTLAGDEGLVIVAIAAPQGEEEPETVAEPAPVEEPAAG